ncbi:hypothetical protein Poli38472_012234 [Pythium oligandrum]|uniref:Uncharacterized protein n=1 Tax=Pythium oligandrum TaxID=41045 RepID=A0A8K1CRR0_PYTOL|nr:hypothetical protein Poli38472_012234 [Pythium oligandrum]|eukprot:TMW67118.1 hypothetical protein Poli38472_012234 [Pythium oligandrum]
MERKFQLVDAAYCFLTRHKATPSIRNVLQMASSLGGEAITQTELREMAAIAPELLQLRALQPKQVQHRDDLFCDRPKAPDELEVMSFPSLPQISQRVVAKRLKIFTEALKHRSNGDPELTAEPPAAAEQSPQPQASEPPVAVDEDPINSSMWVQLLKGMDIYRNQIVHIESRPSRPAQYRSLESLTLPSAVVGALEKRGIKQLYSHQLESIQATMKGENVVLSTSTASGKSLAFNIPTLSWLLEDPQSTFLYFFPTKALAQDQIKSLRQFLHATGLPEHYCATFDGDTPMKARSMLIRKTQIFLTNPDIMHLSILPKHTQWKRVLANLKLVVVDEAHVYRGVFGAHVANVFRRFFRLCALYGSNPRVICCSATVRNPKGHFRMLIPRLPPQDSENAPPNFAFFHERPLCVITQDGASAGEKIFCIWNPKAANDTGAVTKTADPKPNVSTPRKRKRLIEEVMSTDATNDENKSEISSHSTSSIFQSAKIFARLVEEEIHTILFCKGRKLSELVLMSTHSVLGERAETRALIKRVHSYRGGYSPEDRRRIERQLFQGDLLGVIATNALELGIDIGEIDCSMHLGLPTSVASLWQQAGRAGRKHTQQSLALIVCFDSPLDQHFARHGRDLFTMEPEAVTLNPNNSKIVAPHLLCAAHEHALYDRRSGLEYVDRFIFGSDVDASADADSEPASVPQLIRDMLSRQHLYRQSNGDGGGYRVHSCAPKEIRSLSLRCISDIVYKVLTDDAEHVLLDEIPGERVFFQVYPTAVYLHQGREYIITRLDVDQKIAFARRCHQPLTYFTSCRDWTEVDVVKVQERTKWIGSAPEPVFVCLGQVSVNTSVFGSTLLEKKTMRVLHTNEFSLPSMQGFGNALWLEVPNELRVRVESASFVWSGALHGVGHLLLAVVPLFVLCDAGDIDSEHYNPFERRSRPNRITIYEHREGGSGIVEEIVRSLPAILFKAWTIADECSCIVGCPSCIHSAQCTEYNNVLDKRGSLIVLEHLVEAITSS